MDDFRSRILGRVRRMVGVLENGLFRSSVVNGGASERVNQIRLFGTRKLATERSALCEFLEDLIPAVRRNSAWALGHIANNEDANAILDSAVRERCDMPRLSKCVAAVRCGAPVNEAWQILERGAKRSFDGFYGARKTADATGWGVDVMAAIWCRTLSMEGDPLKPAMITPDSIDDIREFLHRCIEGDPDNRDAVLTLGMVGHPDDFDTLFRLSHACGRRMHLTLCAALGYHGDPRSIGWLLGVLNAMDEDPGHGFASRAAAAAALGCLGVPETAEKLVRALQNEERDFEGRPGAGLGIQRSVRTSILGALGELQQRPKVIEGYLSNTDGCATGGFYLPAMDSLWKIGDRRRLSALCSEPAEISANANAVLGALDR
jgi:hypothetical protein